MKCYIVSHIFSFRWFMMSACDKAPWSLLRCSFSFVFRVKVLSQNSQGNFLCHPAPECILSWYTQLFFRLNFFPQIEHEYGLALVCSNTKTIANEFLKSRSKINFVLFTWVMIWFFSVNFNRNFRLQISHWNLRLPSCMAIWYSNSPLWRSCLPHRSHW